MNLEIKNTPRMQKAELVIFRKVDLINQQSGDDPRYLNAVNDKPEQIVDLCF